MDFAFSEQHTDLTGLVRQILADHVTNARLREVEAGDDRFDRALWTDLGKADVLASCLPTSAGGSDLGLVEQCGILAEIGRAVAPVPYCASITMGASALARFGTPEQQDEWATPAGRGELVLTAALADEGSSDLRAPAASAEFAGGSWILNGAKTNVPAGTIADLFLVPARTPSGPAVFLVKPSDNGVTVDRQRIVDSDSEGWIGLSDVRLEGDRVLGEVSSGAEIVDWLVTRGTVGVCATQLGVVERALELTSEYASERVQFGRPIGSFQAVAQRLADAYIDVEAVRLTMWQAAWRVSAGLPADAEVGTAKFWAAEAGHRVAHTAVHVHGGVGIDLDHHLHRYFVAAKRNEFTLGAATTQLRRIGQTLTELTKGTP